jgi:threonine dehydratase
VETDTIDTIADGVAGRCPIPEVLDDLLAVVDDVVLVSEESIKVGMRLLYQHAGLIVEPSAALGVATVLSVTPVAGRGLRGDPLRDQAIRRRGDLIDRYVY